MKADERFLGLDSLRGICALGVACYHFKITEAVLYNRFYENLYVLVDYFFILSGFVIHHAYGRKLTNGAKSVSFLIKRFGRVYPMHFAMLAVMVGLELLKAALILVGVGAETQPFQGAFELDGLFYSLLLMQSVGFHPDGVWNTPSWTISVEWWAYIMYAAVTLLAGHGRRLVFAAIAVVSLLVIISTGTFLKSFSDVGIFRCFLSFLIGVGIHGLYVRYGDRIKAWSNLRVNATEVGLTAAVIAALALVPSVEWTLLFIPLFAVTVLMFAAGRGWVSALLRQPVMLLLGTLSYSIYIINEPLSSTIHRIIGIVGPRIGVDVSGLAENPFVGGEIHVLLLEPGWQVYAGYAAFAGLSVACAWVTYRLIEAPGREWFRKRADDWAAKLVEGEVAIRVKGRLQPRSQPPAASSTPKDTTA